jgi:hypothetical protein
VFGPKREETAGSWGGLHNEKLHNLYASPYIIRVIKYMGMRWAGNVARRGQVRNLYKILFGKAVGKRPIGRSRRS